MALTIFGLFMGIWCLILLLRDARALRHIPQLPPLVLKDHPDVAVIIPARNEERNIAQVVSRMLLQQYSSFSLTIIDDQSSDATAAIVRSFDDPRLQLISSAPLPPDWKGKCWACWQGAQATAAIQPSRWLLFLDADTKPQPELLMRSIAYAEQHQLDLLTLMPYMELGTFWERTIMPAFLSMIQATFPLHKVNRPGSGIVLANGQFILVRRDAYERAGGHRAVYDRVLEDVELAQAVVGAGGTMRAVDGSAVLRVRMYTNGHEVREGLTKNAIAGLRNGGLRASWAGLRQVIVAFVPPALVLGAVWANVRRWTAWQRWLINSITVVVAGFASWSWGRFMQRLYHLPRWWAFFFPLGLLCYMLIAAEAAWRIWRGTGISWKGRTYRD